MLPNTSSEWATALRTLSLQEKFSEIKELLHQKIEESPNQLDFLHGLASTYWLSRQFGQAEQIFKKIIAIDNQNFDAWFKLYLLDKLSGGLAGQELLSQLLRLDELRATKLLELVERAETIRKAPINSKLPTGRKNHTFVLLGYVLNADGTPHQILLDRLELAVKALQKNEDATIIVTGGIWKNDCCEATVMKERLMARGIEESRIVMEPESLDTFGNARYTLKLAKPPFTILTSASHVRRGQMLFQMMSGDFEGVCSVGAFPEGKIDDFANPFEQAQMYFDLLRVLGFWQYPGIYQ